MIPEKAEMRTKCNEWALYMFICSLVALFTGFSQKFSFGVVGENITKNIRKALYTSLLKKNIGWFDDRENAPGVLTSALASEA
jgi:ABC-type multidrug transport system fused ATPase/permease subunit